MKMIKIHVYYNSKFSNSFSTNDIHDNPSTINSSRELNVRNKLDKANSHIKGLSLKQSFDQKMTNFETQYLNYRYRTISEYTCLGIICRLLGEVRLLKTILNDEDHPIQEIRKYVHTRLAKASVSRVIIERTLKLVTVTITTSRPGSIIGKGGQEVDKLREELKKITGKDIQINIFEIKRPELDAPLVAASIARQIENRISYRRAIKMAIAATMRMNAEGIKIQISGRLNGAEMARNESYKEGRIPLSTFRADIDYATDEAHTTYGRMGIKVWIMKGEVYGKRELSPLVGMTKKNLNGSSASKEGSSDAKRARRKK